MGATPCQFESGHRHRGGGMKKFGLCCLAAGGCAAAGALLRGFVFGAKAGDPEYYLLFGSGLAGLCAAAALWVITGGGNA